MNEVQGKLAVSAPAKVNLHLTVLDKRPDGFHNLESVFLAVNLADTLYFEPIEPENSIEIDMQGINSPIPTEKNIIFKAVSLFRQKTGFSQGLKITVEKRIPLGGGLGGGSSDAASTLLALNKLAGSPCGKDTLLEMASSLGSDVPFFIHEITAAIVTGRGEHIQPIETPPMHLVLVNPGFPSDTAAAFRLLDDYREREKDYANDFLSIFPEKEKSVYNEIISRLKELGAANANLSGAGSTCFGVFEDGGQAQKAAEAMHDSWEFSAFCSTKQ
ncbi:MAG: 4-(cytidine 5'-diphospho)-2-C-methyl-D-erythritol kinase [Treponema sp.]|nr:4-(cytidine 5'-diphospho)-2-C-methyl-D-erythritol kinase [Treponema sp.]